MIKRREKEETEEEVTEVTEEEKPKKVNIKKERTIIVTELPKQEVRKAPMEDGSIVNILSLEEGLTEILEKVREIYKGVVG